MGDKIEPVAKFKSMGSFNNVILRTGKYPVFSVVNDQRRDRDNDGLMGNIVEIDGILYQVKGVESYAIPFIREGDPIGLAVEKIT